MLLKTCKCCNNGAALVSILLYFGMCDSAFSFFLQVLSTRPVYHFPDFLWKIEVVNWKQVVKTKTGVQKKTKPQKPQSNPKAHIPK